MTTIVYDSNKKQIACDSRFVADGVVLTNDAEKWKIKSDGSTWFFTGDISDSEILMNLEHNEKPSVMPDANAMYAKDGKAFLVTFNGDYCSHTELTFSHAIGSGWKFALSALDFSCNAEKAVSFASERDCFTGGKIRVFNVVTGEFA